MQLVLSPKAAAASCLRHTFRRSRQVRCVAEVSLQAKAGRCTRGWVVLGCLVFFAGWSAGWIGRLAPLMERAPPVHTNILAPRSVEMCHCARPPFQPNSACGKVRAGRGTLHSFDTCGNSNRCSAHGSLGFTDGDRG